MYAVGRLGSYISRGVYTVSGPFHPFGGAVDIIVVEQQDGSFKSSPWYVRFGKFQGVLKSKEKVVSISVDGIEADFHMYLDNKGEAYFLREVEDGEERESGLYPLSSGEETDGQSLDDRRPFKSRSCNFDAIKSSPGHQIDMHSQRAVTRAKSSQSRLMGIFGRNTMEEACHEQEGDTSVVRVSSLERAEMAADLLELQWSTNISDKKTRKDNDSNLSSLDKLDGKVDEDLQANNELSQASCAHDDTKNSLDQAVLVEETVSHYEQFDSSSKSDSEKLKCSVEEASAGVSCVRTHEKVVETSTLGESVLKEKCEVVSLISRVTDETCAGNADLDGAEKGAFCEITGSNSRVTGETSVGSDDPNGNANGVTSEIADSNSERSYTKVLDGCSSQKFLVEQVSNERDTVVLGRDISQMDSRNNGVQSSIHCEMSDSSIAGTDNCSKQTYQTLDLGNEGSGKVCVHAKTLNGTTELPFEDNGIKQLMGDARLETELVELTENHCHQTNSPCSCSTDHNEDPKKSLTVTESFKQIIRVDPINGSVEEVKSHDICTTFNSSNTGQAVKGEEKVRDESFNTSIQYNLASSGDSPKLYGDSTSTKAMSSTLSQSSDEEQFLFGDFDEDKLNAVQTMDPKSPDHMDKDYHSSFRLEGAKEHKSVSTSYESYSSLDKYMLENPSVDTESSIVKSRVMSSAINVPMSPKTPGEGVGRLGESVPNMWFRIDNFDNHSNACHPLSHSLDASPKSLKWTLLSNDDSNCLDSDTEEEEQLTKKVLNNEDSQISGEPNSASASPAVGTLSFGGKQKTESEGTIAIDRVEKPNEGETPKARGRWRLWPFTFISSRPVKAKQPASGDTRIPDAEDTTRITASIDESRDELIPKGVKKMYRALTPTSEQLLSLNLSEGRNTITFTFSTGMLGNQQVDARIYLWKWNTRIVISDVDGTITKSDVLGQFMPMVGIDWCQTGVTHLFSAIKENGYQLLFLSARAIAQAYHTRQFLLNIKQDGKALPDGPIVISPDGLFPSLFREVIRRAPHEFKIACLEDIKSLFPSDINPFYAGFGNRDTDEISYLKVGIPKGKIFIINPKGEVAVNRRVDTKSYTSLHDLVHDMFPPTEPEQEDYNSWNFWKLPPPSLDM